MLPAIASPRRFAEAGYTLIEMLIVISLMGILAAVLLPRFEPSVHDQLQGAVQIIAADIAYARNLAVTHDSHYALTFDATKNCYTLEHTGVNSLLHVLPRTPYRHFDDKPEEQVTLLANLPHIGPAVELYGVQRGSSAVVAKDVLEFHSLGGVNGGVKVTLWLACGVGEARRYQSLTIAPVTGLVTAGEFRAAPP